MTWEHHLLNSYIDIQNDPYLDDFPLENGDVTVIFQYPYEFTLPNGPGPGAVNERHDQRMHRGAGSGDDPGKGKCLTRFLVMLTCSSLYVFCMFLYVFECF